MSRDRLRVALVSELPTPYRWPVFERLLAREELDLRIFYCARTESDRSWSFPFRPDHRVKFLPTKTVSVKGRRTIHYHVNPTWLGELRRGRFDVVVFPGYAMFASHTGELWCRIHRRPYVIFSETSALDVRGAARRVFKRLFLPVFVGGAAAWLATGIRSREYMASYGADPARTFFFPNTPDVGAFAAAAEQARGPSGREAAANRPGGADRAPVVLYVGRLIGVKRVDLLLRAAARLVGAGRRLELRIVGDGADRGALERLAATLGLPDVRFLGSQPTARLPAIYADADLFVLPSDHEPWGAVVCEAMACALPVVLSNRVASWPDLVAEGENGHVFPHGDFEALAAVLDRVLWDPERVRRMGRRSAERISAFTPERCVEEFLRAVRTAAEAGQP